MHINTGLRFLTLHFHGMDYDKYKGFLAYNTNIIELEIEEPSNFETKTEGDFYAIEID